MKRLLIDTHVFIWWLTDDPSLGPATRSVISRGSNQVYVSAATSWEISIKRSLGKLYFDTDIEEAIEKNQFYSLPISLAHGEQAGLLPRHHGDPFDRMLIAQSQMEGMILVSADSAFEQYGIRLMNARR